jgi:AdoMet-dependent rRNA methyltransferase SPB1
VSAEIFVVCRDFLAPKKIDPRLLDPAFVFKEVDDIESDGKTLKEKQGAVLNNIFHPEKRHRHREGYQDGDYTLHQKNSVAEFIESGDFLDILAKSSCLDFNMDDKSKEILNNVLTTEEIQECCKDLKVIGKKDFKGLIKWRDSLRIDLGLSKSRKEMEQERKLKEEEAAKLQDTDEALAEKIAEESRLAQLVQKKTKKKQKEKKMKHLLKLRLGMDTPHDIGMDASILTLSGDQEYDFATKEQPSLMADTSDSEKVSEQMESDADSEAYDSEDEQIKKMNGLETEIDELFEDFLARKVKKSPKETVKKDKEGAKQKFEEWYGIEYEKKLEQGKTDVNEDSSEFSDSSSEAEVNEDEESAEKELSEDAKMFFDNPVFKSLETENPSTFEKEINNVSDDSSDDKDILSGLRNSKKRKRSKDSKEKNKDEKEIEIVPLEKDISDDEGKMIILILGNYAIETAQEYALAQKLIRPSKRRDVMDEAYNRYAFNDPDLPSWFMEDEGRHNKPTMPVTKEAVEIMKQKAKAFDARPIKKVAEAKFRKQMRAQRRIDKMMKKAAVMNDDEDMTEKSKLSKIAEMMSKAKVKPKKEDKKPKLVIARGSNRGNKGRPKGVKGRYKMVDSRMKKEVRADKRKKAATKKRRK